ncbi:hypothetical protein LMH87_006672 [Akanthomyces muscarius]|uniref:Uncharacterized protein n=1 Tax=Akanthomyces muscarius TaxID=2231603 RepID=A0A9W8UT89_AKAMU|nr:hypothetical protein LMH87_006672 [Akanthomyces muscarius]KAJ4165023.1 hypothetical protein LMH87_006672 [Akanthomyces muscarius]
MPNHDTQQNQAFKLPNILPDELAGFHDAHFSSAALSSFQKDFVLPNSQATLCEGEVAEDWEEEDDLGYYEDGVKRTLTDEQIEIFRHSELRELERAKEKASKLHQSEVSSGEPGTPGIQPNSTAANKPRDGKKGKKSWAGLS